MEDDKKKLEIVSGDGENLDISPVYEHLNTVKPKCDNKPKHIIIPKAKKEEEDDEDVENKKEASPSDKKEVRYE